MSKSVTRKELYDLVWSTPMIKLAKEFNLSDNGLRKVCKKYNIPIPSDLQHHFAPLPYLAHVC